MKKYSVFDLNVAVFDGVSDAACQIKELDSQGGIMLAALNPEKVMSSMNDRDVKDILSNCDVLYADGIGIVKSIERKYDVTHSRVPGCELWEELVKEFSKGNSPIYILGASTKVNDETTNKLKMQYNANIVGARDGFFDNDEMVINDIIDSKAKFVSVAMGSPRQEKFISRCKKMGVNAVMMGVGGTYDVYTDNVKRAPKFWCNMGLEWLYRLLSQPTRIKRQAKLIKFAFRLLTNRY